MKKNKEITVDSVIIEGIYNTTYKSKVKTLENDRIKAKRFVNKKSLTRLKSILSARIAKEHKSKLNTAKQNKINLDIYLNYLECEINKKIDRSVKRIYENRNSEIDPQNNINYYKEIFEEIKKNLKRNKKLTFYKYKPVSTYVAKSLMVLANAITKRTNFYNYTFKDEMQSEALIQCIKYVSNFSYYNKNAHSYFTMTIINTYLRTIEKEKKQNFVAHTLKEEYIRDLKALGLDIRKIY